MTYLVLLFDCLTDRVQHSLHLAADRDRDSGHVEGQTGADTPAVTPSSRGHVCSYSFPMGPTSCQSIRLCPLITTVDVCTTCLLMCMSNLCIYLVWNTFSFLKILLQSLLTSGGRALSIFVVWDWKFQAANDYSNSFTSLLECIMITCIEWLDLLICLVEIRFQRHTKHSITHS